jgi:hypothetical protein
VFEPTISLTGEQGMVQSMVHGIALLKISALWMKILAST